MQDFGKLLRLVRRYTGDAFSAANGYDLRKPLNFGQRMAILRYANRIVELTSQPHVTYRPKRGQKTEAFSYTNQKGWSKFDTAIIHAPDASAKLVFDIDKRRPRGSRFVVTNSNTGQRYYHIPARAFLGFDEEDEDLSETEFYEGVLRDYAEDAEFFLIEAGESYMWGAGGGHAAVANKLEKIIQNYGSSNFSANDKNSSHYRNWFRGVTGYTNRFDIVPQIGQALQRQRERGEKYGIDPTRRFRRLKDGSIGEFRNGNLLGRFWIEEYE